MKFWSFCIFNNWRVGACFICRLYFFGFSLMFWCNAFVVLKMSIWILWIIPICELWVKIISCSVLSVVVSFSRNIKWSIIIIFSIRSVVRIVLWFIVRVVSITIILIILIAVACGVSWAVIGIVCIPRVWKWAIYVIVWSNSSIKVLSRATISTLIILTIRSTLSIL